MGAIKKYMEPVARARIVGFSVAKNSGQAAMSKKSVHHFDGRHAGRSPRISCYL